MDRHEILPRLGRVLALASLLSLASCSGGKEGSTPGSSTQTGVRAQLQTVQYGRLVDVYAYRRRDPSNSDRLLPANREPVLFERDVLIDPFLQTEDPFANRNSPERARFRFLPYDPSVGHREVVILFDDQHPEEKANFEASLAAAKSNLVAVQPFSAFQPGPKGPAPVVTSDGAMLLTFDRPLGVQTSFFLSTPTAVQVLAIVGDPEKLPPSRAYIPITARVVSKENGRLLIVDPEVSGNEAKGMNPNPGGLPLSLDSKAANVRIALPTSGIVNESFRVAPDRNAALNSLDLRSETAVIRDFRVANHDDPDFGGLPPIDVPELVALKEVGIMALKIIRETHPNTGEVVDRRILELNKRFTDLVVRGRIPFIDGPISETDGRPIGPRGVPQGRSFQYGDMVFQDVVSPKTGELVRVKAEVIRNLDIVDIEGKSDLGVGGGNPVARVEVGTFEAVDSSGNPVTFQANDLPLGETCFIKVHYHDQIKLSGGQEVGDGQGSPEAIARRRAEFLVFDPAPPRLDQNRQVLQPNEKVSPLATVTVEFSKPMAMDTVRTEDNVVIANWQGQDPAFVDHVKIGNIVVVPTSAADLRNDATSVRLTSPMGLFHRKKNPQKGEEVYYVHLKDGASGARDRAGKTIDLFDDDKDLVALTFNFTLDEDADDNFIGNIQRRMNSPDEDGTTDGAIVQDYFGQFTQDSRLGRLSGAPAVRFAKNADRQGLSLVLRGNSGECQDPMGNPLGSPVPVYTVTLLNPGSNPPGFGIPEPFVTLGSRVMTAIREDDWGLSNRSPFDMEIDVEQLFWAPYVFRSPSILFDVFDRMTIVLSTSEKRPDIRVMGNAGSPGPPPVPPSCAVDATTTRSGLVTTFAQNYIDNGTRVEVVKDRVVSIDPNDIFASETGETVITYPEFKETYTWRDRRIVGWDAKTGKAIGLGGSVNATGQNNPDKTTDVTSPWIPEHKTTPTGYDVTHADDFKGDKDQDHNPIALPLLVDFLVWPDDPDNGAAEGRNLWQLATMGGYYSTSRVPPTMGDPPAPFNRVHSTGHRKVPGLPVPETPIDPGNEFVARGTWLINDPILTPPPFHAGPGDSHLYWTRAEFVRKVSVVTYGYVDTLLPAKNDVSGPTGWQGRGNGFPNIVNLGSELRPADFAVLMRPSAEDLPAGTRIIVEFRGSESIEKPDVYAFKATESASDRNNLLNPNYACEQFRYTASARVAATGVTNYVTKPEFLIDNKTGVAPRFLNWRFTFVNNTEVTPALVPFIDYFAIVYRAKTKQ